jgi:hypothetical protein
VQGKKGCDESARPKVGRHAFEYKKKQKGICQMKQQIGKVMAACIQTIKVAVKHVRYCRQRMIISALVMRKKPKNVVPCQAVYNMAVVENIPVVIKTDKLVVTNLPENNQRAQRQCKTDKKSQVFV